MTLTLSHYVMKKKIASLYDHTIPSASIRFPSPTDLNLTFYFGIFEFKLTDLIIVFVIDRFADVQTSICRHGSLTNYMQT